MITQIQWKKPNLEILDISMTMKKGHAPKENGDPGNPNYGGIPGCNPSGNQPKKCNSNSFDS
ncbi:paeninodin family lasso peptide [Bacillus sp. AGMB 02131]|uniref:Paeninodin family lasso peptide n=1 Tax=Peribacillus faecalis TaxID=2772559 RepID=A0A927HAK9_9BACI|nr:paeninodin family lasso peptide [Peribacillus faecalis]MBD3107662.1 paeninodin family lasso peptide [Peribacillus faecalis]